MQDVIFEYNTMKHRFVERLREFAEHPERRLMSLLEVYELAYRHAVEDVLSARKSDARPGSDERVDEYVARYAAGRPVTRDDDFDGDDDES